MIRGIKVRGNEEGEEGRRKVRTGGVEEVFSMSHVVYSWHACIVMVYLLMANPPFTRNFILSAHLQQPCIITITMETIKILITW